jgi:hypothetical protein
MSVFVENLRSMLNRHFLIRDETLGEQVISVWSNMGLNLEGELDVTIHMLLPTETAATELAFRTEGLPGLINTAVQQIPPQNELTGELTATFRLLLTAETLDTLERLMCALGADLGAASDGWSLDADTAAEAIAA